MSFFANAKSALLSGSTTTTTNDESSTQLNPTNNQPSGATATLNNAIPQIPPQLGQGGTFGSAQRTSSARFTAGTAPNQSGFSFGGASVTNASTGNTFNNSSQTAQTTSPSRGFGAGFGGASTNAFSGFGQPSTGGFGQATTTSFGQPAQTTTFGQPLGGFGQAPRTTTTTSSGTFGGRPATSGFGQATTTSFGQPAQTTTTFGQPIQTSTTQPAQTTARGFGQPSTTFGGVSTTSPLTTQAGGFGQTTTTSTFGQSTQATGGFGQPATSGFGQTTQFGRFGQTATTGTFGQATQAGGFGQTATTTFGQGTQATGRMSQVTPNNSGQPQSEFPGTIGHMGRVHVYADTARNWAVASITGAIRDQGLEELRVRDYWALKRKTINQEKITQIENVLQQNINARNSGFIPPPLNTVPPNQHVAPLRLPQNNGGAFGTSANPGFSGGNQAQTPFAPMGTTFGTTNTGGVFSSTGLASTTSMQSTTQPFGASANPFNNAQATTSAFGAGNIKPTPTGSFGNTNPLPMQKFGASVATNPSEKVEEKPKNAPIFGQKPLKKLGSTDEEPSVKKSEKTKSHPRTILSKPGSFTHELNLMLFVSKFVDLLEEHNLSPPEGLLDETDFAPRLFEFLEDFSIKPPTETVPRFKITTTQQGMLHSTPIKSERRKKHTTKAQSKENEAAKIPSGKKEVIEESSDEDSEDSEEEKVEIVPKKQTIVEEEKKIEEKEEKEEKKEISEDNETKKEIIGQEEQISQQIPTSEVSTTEGTSVNQSTTEQNEVKEPSSAEEVISTTF